MALPDKDVAPGIREGLRDRAHWTLHEAVPLFGAVEPREGPGQVFPYFTIRKLCDPRTTLSEATWRPLIDHPSEVPDIDPRTRPGGDPDPDWRQVLTEHADKLAATGRPGSDLAAVSSTIFSLPPARVPGYLQAQVPDLFEAHPEGSLWFVHTDSLLSRRLAVLRVLLAFELLPDYGDALTKTPASTRES
jgi:hypothetical protein